MTELLTYIEPSIIVSIRNKNYTDAPDNMKRILYPMRICKISDFKDIGYEAPESFLNLTKNRLCPHIPN
jgi:hypothetical protein